MKKLLTVLVTSLALLLPNIASAGSVKSYKIELNEDSRLVLIKGPIRAAMADDIISEIYDLDLEGNRPIYYLINTNGGSLSAGNSIIRAMKGAKSPSICVVDRAAYSMGALILTHCDVSYIYKDASVMFHEGYIGMRGRLSEVFSYIEFEKKEFDKLNKTTAKLLKMKLKTYIAKQKDEWWLTSEEAVKMGLAKGILTKLVYPLRTQAGPPPFFTFGGFDWTERDGHIDLTHYPFDNPWDRSYGDY